MRKTKTKRISFLGFDAIVTIGFPQVWLRAYNPKGWPKSHIHPLKKFMLDGYKAIKVGGEFKVKWLML